MRKSPHPTTQLSTHIRTDLHDQLADLAHVEGRHMRWIVEKALEAYLDQAEQLKAPQPQ